MGLPSRKKLPTTVTTLLIFSQTNTGEAKRKNKAKQKGVGVGVENSLQGNNEF